MDMTRDRARAKSRAQDQGLELEACPSSGRSSTTAQPRRPAGPVGNSAVGSARARRERVRVSLLPTQWRSSAPCISAQISPVRLDFIAGRAYG
jgi:hypothetical protein